MNRRELLEIGGAAFGASALAGCASSVPFVGGRPEVREVAGDEVDRGVPSAFPQDEVEEPFVTLAVGERGGDSHQVWVWNRSNARRKFALGIGDASDADPWFRRSYEFGPGAGLAVDLRTARAYAITVSVGDLSETVEIAKSQFDCNESATDVAVGDDGMETKTTSTAMACGDLW